MHVLIVGTTLSGKTTVAKQLANRARLAGRNVLVYDPLLDPSWECDHITDDMGQFLELAKQNKNCQLIVDEAGEACSQYDKETYWLATQARHWGHQTIFLSQRANMVAKSIRDNCSKLFCFRISPTDAKLLADDFCYKELLTAPELSQGECLYIPRYGSVQRLNVFQK